MDFEIKKQYHFDDLLQVMRILRSEEGCMWDRQQDHHSIRRDFIEETYEVCEAIDNEDTELLKEELGDVLFQVVFHTTIEEEQGHFDIDDVIDGICKKMIYRHPHVFKDVQVDSTQDILNNWDDLKKTEKHQESVTDTMNSVARTLPALIRAEKVMKKAEKAGFEWNSVENALDKVQEELDEVRRAEHGDGNLPEEIGDLLFAAVKVAKFAHTDPEEALNHTTEKFIHRFSHVEEGAAAQGKQVGDLTLREMLELWEESKRDEQKRID
ncbi:nucleoside triphosphate pyrophosphohydrolase [Butyricicoccus sp.]|uniref:nucleoside triphosphate pyrophosphohydrolase n=1 Tax=Butyricicoccus sp. TaxID=2049021 RepID=UPI003D7DE76E